MIKFTLRETVKVFVWFVFLASGFFIYMTVIKFIPLVFMIAVLVTESESLIIILPMFIKLWFGFNLVFILSVIVIVFERFLIKKKVKKK
ncbi:MAG TPA: hypothetical protein ENH99_02825 [Candidatus Pacearchaeota archaeon]|uniref:Uncharacterized protein n=1 Tax=marine sediment metagenome TaxID=412755 RepID=A0A0F8ZFB6_9ZZZZ|nr:hypothetical protein [Candidatus Pacearchaeota archaeon]